MPTMFCLIFFQVFPGGIKSKFMRSDRLAKYTFRMGACRKGPGFPKLVFDPFISAQTFFSTYFSPGQGNPIPLELRHCFWAKTSPIPEYTFNEYKMLHPFIDLQLSSRGRSRGPLVPWSLGPLFPCPTSVPSSFTLGVYPERSHHGTVQRSFRRPD